MSKLARVGLSYIDEAPTRLSCTFSVAAPRERVFEAIAADPAGWAQWFPGFSNDGCWLTPEPRGVGSVRTISVVGRRLRETILAWEDNLHWAFRADEAELAGLRALVEDYKFRIDGRDRTAIVWSCGLDSRPRSLIAPVMRLAVPRVMARAGHNLATELKRQSG